MESNSGLKRILKSQVGYRLFQDLIGSTRATKKLVEDYLGDTSNLSVIDIGSGDSNILQFINPISYTAIEPNPSYIQAATKQFGDRVTPIHIKIGDPKLNALNLKADLVLILGVLHHLDDNLAKTCLSFARQCLKDSNSRVFIFEAVLTPKQNPIARFLIKNDRGKNVRDRDGYQNLLGQFFSNHQVEVRHDILRIPYSHFLATARHEDAE